MSADPRDRLVQRTRAPFLAGRWERVQEVGEFLPGVVREALTGLTDDELAQVAARA